MERAIGHYRRRHSGVGAGQRGEAPARPSLVVNQRRSTPAVGRRRWRSGGAARRSGQSAPRRHGAGGGGEVAAARRSGQSVLRRHGAGGGGEVARLAVVVNQRLRGRRRGLGGGEENSRGRSSVVVNQLRSAGTGPAVAFRRNGYIQFCEARCAPIDRNRTHVIEETCCPQFSLDCGRSRLGDNGS